ncbi:MAG: HAD-IC family P-type ATPase [Acidobacteria bacterium]|nr:HAD-IC family P-type ATPase [Acidobacteriota bacterium]
MTISARQADYERNGLSRREVAERVEAGHVNAVDDGPTKTIADIVRSNVVTRFNILLGTLLAVVLLIVRSVPDALFGGVLVSNALIGIVQEIRAKRTLDELTVLAAPSATVIRDGVTIELAVEEIVLHDLVRIKTGDQVQVDGQVVKSASLEIDESLLTGEADSVVKTEGAEVLSGSFVVAGTGTFMASRVGEDAYARKLANEARQFVMVRSELRDGIDLLLKGITWVIGPIIVLLTWNQLRTGGDWIEALRSAVAGAVGIIPQGLVLLTSVAFAVGVVRLGKRNVLVQELSAIEGLARVDIVCFDKTGTLTEGRLDVTEVIALSGNDVSDAIAVLAGLDPTPNPTMSAIAAAYPHTPNWPEGKVVPFSSERKWSGATFGSSNTWLLGAPDVLTPRDEEVTEQVTRLSKRGLRVMMVASSPQPLIDNALPAKITPEALLCLGDVIRPDAAETLRYFASQGVQVKVISGDHPDTVAAIAQAVGVPGSQSVVDARELPSDPEQLASVMEATTVFGRVSPHQKQAMVRALQSRGHTVAMTGDGVNDVLALKEADIGIAVGSGASASRAVAQLILLDGRFDTLPHVVAEGRKVISNIERVANLFVTKTVYALFLAIAVGFAARPFPFLPRHLTLVGTVTIGIPAFFLALAPTTQRVRRGFVMRVLRFAIPVGLAAGVATFSAYEMAIQENLDLIEARTTATFVLAALGIVSLAMVARPIVDWKRWLVGGMAGMLTLLFLLPASRDFFELRLPNLTLSMAALGVTGLAGFLMIVALRAVGWLKAVPTVLREHPPLQSATWRDLGTIVRQTVTTFGDDAETTLEPTNDPPVSDALADDPLADIEWVDGHSDY